MAVIRPQPSILSWIQVGRGKWWVLSVWNNDCQWHIPPFLPPLDLLTEASCISVQVSWDSGNGLIGFIWLEQFRKPSEEHLPWQDCRGETDLPLEVHRDVHLGQRGGWMGQFPPCMGTAFFSTPRVITTNINDRFQRALQTKLSEYHLNLWLHFYPYLDKLGQHLFCACVYIQTHMCTHLDTLATKP